MIVYFSNLMDVMNILWFHDTVYGLDVGFVSVTTCCS